jgi:ligand-binding sensor domain-containing protein
MKKGCFNCILLLIFFYQSPAQENLLFKTYSFAQGLNSYNIFKTSQDAYGFIWIATQDGLFRFNGKGFEVIKNNTGYVNSTMGNAFADVVMGADNQVYTADYYHGIDIIDAATWQVNYIGDENYPNHKLPNYWIEKICIDKGLNLWLGGKGYIAFKRRGDKIFTVLDKLPGLTDGINISFIKQVSDSCVALGVINYGVIFFNTNTLQQSGLITLSNDAFAGMAVNDIYRNGDTAFAITNTAIIKGVMVNNKWQNVLKYTPSTLQNLLTTSVAHDKSNGLWIGTNAGIVYFNTATQQSEIFKADKRKANWLKDNYINHLMIDNQDNLWISTFNVLQMVSLKGNQFKSYSGDKEGSDYMEHIYSLVTKSKTEIFCTGTDGLYITNIETGITKRITGSNTLGLVHHIEKIEENCWIISADKGMYAYEPVSKQISQQRLLQKYPEWNICRNNYFNNAYQKNGIWYWASEEREGLVKWDKQRHTITQFKAGTFKSGGLTEGHIRNIKTDREGFLWVLSDATLSKFNMTKDTVEEILYLKSNKNAPKASLYFDMYDDGKTLWFASYGAGLCGYDKTSKTWQFINEQNGLCNNSVYSILPENDSVFWVSTNMGLSRVNFFTKLCSNFFYEDGLQDNSFDEKGGLIFDDKLLFGGINGFTAVDIKKKKSNNYNFPVFIHYAEYFVDNKKYSIRKLKWDKLELPNGTNRVEIFLTALTFTENHKIKFSYKIEGIHKNYIDAGSANSIILNALGYGTYHISIGYRMPNGIYVNDALQIAIYIKPKWHQTWAFYLLLVLTVSAILYCLYRYRITQIKKQHEIRKNIATDLHDDLGSTLNSVKIFTNLAISGIKQQESLQQVKGNLTEATTSLRDMIWVLDDSLDTVDELITRLKQFAIPVAAASNIEATIKADSGVNSRQLIKEEKRNLFLICKEAINNSIKYSVASQIDVAITASGKKIRIVVADNGKGFNVDEVKKGYGLKNMQYRAGQIKYKVTLASSPGNGTQITILPS